MIIAKEFDFDAAHVLYGLPHWHKCGRLHGHTYRVVLGFQGQPDKSTGFLAGIDYADVANVWNPIHTDLDHRVLNDVSGLGNPTTENLVIYICKRVAESRLGHALAFVRVYESATTFCEILADEILPGGE